MASNKKKRRRQRQQRLESLSKRNACKSSVAQNNSMIDTFFASTFNGCKIKTVQPLKETKKASNDSNTRLFEVKSGHMSLLENKDEIVKIMHFIDFFCIS